MLHVLPSLCAGGAERLVVFDVTRLPRERYEAVVCCLVEHGALADEVQRVGIPIVVLGGFPGLAHPPRLIHLFRIIRRVRPDIVHTHLQSANLFARALAILARVPVVVASEHNVYSGKHRRYIYLERLLAKKTHAIIAVSDEVRRYLAAQLGISPELIRVIPNGVDCLVPNPVRVAEMRAKLAIDGETFVLGVVASLTPKKGHEHLIRALPLLKQPGRFRLLLAGEGPERSRLAQLAESLGVAGQLTFLGLQRNVADVLALLDLFVLPSLTEGMPLALLEAMAAGVPVLATSVGGVPEVVRHGKTGWLVPAASSSALAEAIEDLADRPMVRRNMSLAGRVAVQASYSANHHVAELDRLYVQLVSSMGEARV